MSLRHNSLLDDDGDDIFEQSFSANYEAEMSTDFRVDKDDIQALPSCNYHGQDDNVTRGQHHRKLKVKRLFVEECEEENTPTKQLIPVSSVSGNFPLAFNFKYFNRMQSEAFETVFQSDRNCVVSAPTGSGKTVLFELAIIRYLNGSANELPNKKALYIAPTKSLCFEIKTQWTKKFPSLTIALLTSDSSSHEIDTVKRANIIVATPEKWDLLTRKWTDYNKLFELVQLVLTDEIHTIGEARGATLEAVLTRMNTMGRNVRVVGISATIPNIQDISRWLKQSNTQEEAVALKFDDSYRQVQLEKHVLGYNFNSKNDFQRDAQYNQKIVDLIVKYSKGRPVLIFCPTRASTMSTAKCISETYRCPNRVRCETSNVMDGSLRTVMNAGVAFHHAGLMNSDRSYVETSFLNGDITILCATSTLAVGVNLPAYLVIIKGTKIWSVSQQEEYSNLDIQQMIGRAGRPQFEKNGCAIIMTEPAMVHKYENLISGSGILESQLHLNLREHICAEISLGVINSVDTAVSWIKSTFFYIRYCQNKPYYKEILKFSQFDINESLTRFCQFIFNLLIEKELITNSGSSITCTAFGHAMVKHYVSFKTTTTILKAKTSAKVQDILEILSNAEEFNDCRVRQNEKKLYREINLSPLTRYPLLTSNKQSLIIDQINRKVSLIIQYELGGLEFPNYEGARKLHHILVQDKTRIFKHSFRILRCMIDCFIHKKDGISLESSLFLLRSLNGLCWEDSPLTMRQIKNIGLVSVRKLVNNNISNILDLRKVSDQKLEYYLGLKFGSGSKIKKDIDQLPDFSIHLKLEKQVKSEGLVRLTFKIEISNNSKTNTWYGSRLSLDITTRLSSGLLVDFRRIFASQLLVPKSFRLQIPITSYADNVEFSINCQEIAGLGKHMTYSSKDLDIPNYHVPNLHKQLNEVTKPPKSVLDGYLSSSSDDSLCDYLANKVKPICTNNTGNKVIKEAKSDYFEGRRQLSNGNYECHHSCNQKGQCRHFCCHDGIPKNMIKRRKTLTRSVFPDNNGPSINEYSHTERQNMQPSATRNTLQHDPFALDSSTPSDIAEFEEELSDVVTERTDHKYNEMALDDSLQHERPFASSTLPQRCHQTAVVTTVECTPSDKTSSSSGNSVDLCFLGSDVELL